MKYFTLDELCVTHRKDLQDYPDKQCRNNLEWLVLNVLDPLREVCGPLVVVSGYRSEALNRAVGGSETSQHLLGEAVDLIPKRCSATELALAAETLRLPIYQFIFYPLESNPSRVHIGMARNGLLDPLHSMQLKVCNGRKSYVTYTGWLKSKGISNG